MFFINGVVTSLFIPILMLLWISVNRGGEQFQGLFNLFTKNNSDILVFIVIIVLYVNGGINGTAASSISREGKNFWYSKTLPISYKEQIAGKYLHALGISIVGYIGGFIILFFILKINLFLILKGTIPEFALITIGIAFSLLLDLRKPILDWENHKKAMKQNPNVMKSVLFMSGFVAISGFLIYKLIKNNYVHLNSLYYILTFVLILISVLINFYLFKNLEKFYSKIEV
jgi:ABC-2 type transport system permease protein